MKVAYVEKSGPHIIVGRDISPEELLECDVILWNQLGCHILIPKEIVANVKQLVLDYQHVPPSHRKLPPKFYFEWPQQKQSVVTISGCFKVWEPNEESSDPPSAEK